MVSSFRWNQWYILNIGWGCSYVSRIITTDILSCSHYVRDNSESKPVSTCYCHYNICQNGRWLRIHQVHLRSINRIERLSRTWRTHSCLKNVPSSWRSNECATSGNSEIDKLVDLPLESSIIWALCFSCVESIRKSCWNNTSSVHLHSHLKRRLVQLPWRF